MLLWKRVKLISKSLVSTRVYLNCGFALELPEKTLKSAPPSSLYCPPTDLKVTLGI